MTQNKEVKLKTYLVGGAVRDELLGLPVKERDWVVVGSSPQQLVDLGYKPVGKDFPVFLHPETHEEYALARTERKIAKGYKGFSFYADSDVTLEQDLQRRDLTINAIAKDEHGNLIDPFHGQQDLQQKRLRHVSAAFSEDPVRILRVARFAAKFPEFTVDAETNKLMQQMVTSGEVSALVAERVWKEWARALNESAPERFFEVLIDCNAFDILFPELTDHLPTLADGCLNAAQRFALLTLQLDEPSLKQLCQRYKVPTEFRELALTCHNLEPLYLALDRQRAEDILEFLKRSDAMRRTERFLLMLNVLNHIHKLHHQDYLCQSLEAIKKIDTTELQNHKLIGREFADKLAAMQLDAIKKQLLS